MASDFNYFFLEVLKRTDVVSQETALHRLLGEVAFCVERGEKLKIESSLKKDFIQVLTQVCLTNVNISTVDSAITVLNFLSPEDGLQVAKKTIPFAYEKWLSCNMLLNNLVNVIDHWERIKVSPEIGEDEAATSARKFLEDNYF